ncbi:MobC family plasmid mobilization relaxosome protein [Streptomyces sp. NPDC055078]
MSTVKHDPHHSYSIDGRVAPPTKSPKLLDRLRHALTTVAPGGASSTPSPTQGRSSGISAPGVAETARRQGAPDREVGAEGGPDQDELHTVQQQILHATPTTEPPTGERDMQSVQPAIRRFTGTKRTIRVGPLRFTGDEHADLQKAAAEHGYKGGSGFAADIVLAFITGRFTANLPLSEDRRRTHMFRAQVLRELNRIGVNVNQIARALNSDLTPPDVRHRLDELHHLLELIAEGLRKPAGTGTDPAA